MCSSLACGYRRGPRETEVESARQDRMTERQEARAAGLQRGAGGSQRSRPGAPAWSSRRGPDDRGRGGWAGGGYGRGAAGSGGRRAGLGAEAGAGPRAEADAGQGRSAEGLSPQAGSVLSRSRVSVSTRGHWRGEGAGELARGSQLPQTSASLLSDRRAACALELSRSNDLVHRPPSRPLARAEPRRLSKVKTRSPVNALLVRTFSPPLCDRKSRVMSR